MRTELTETGWKEISTKNINITRRPDTLNNPLMPVSQWVDFNRRHPGIGRKRKTCNFCKKEWAGIPGGINLLFTDKGNKAVCDKCLEILTEVKIKEKTP